MPTLFLYACQVGAALNADAESGVSLGCLELTANDALVLFPLFHAKVCQVCMIENACTLVLDILSPGHLLLPREAFIVFLLLCTYYADDSTAEV